MEYKAEMSGIQYKVEERSKECIGRRDSVLGRVEGLGPPDLCCLVYAPQYSGLKKLFSFTKPHSRFHFVCGGQTSVSAISAYFLQFDKLAGFTLMEGVYCVYDLFSKKDVRVTATIPGAVVHCAVNADQTTAEASERILKGAYISSILRYMFPTSLCPCRFLNPFETIDHLKAFVEVACHFWDDIGVVLGDPRDSVLYGEHLLFHALSRRLIDLRQMKIHRLYFEKLTVKEPLLMGFLVDGAIAFNQHTNTIKKSLEQLVEQSRSSFLQLALVKLLCARYEYRQAEDILQELVPRHPDCFPLWEELAKLFLQRHDHRRALQALNCVRTNGRTEDRLRRYFHERASLSLARPLAIESLAAIWNKPQFFDFLPFPEKNTQDYSHEAELKHNLFQLPALSFHSHKKKLYKILVKLYVARDWQYLLQLREELFSIASAGLLIPGLQQVSRVVHRRSESAFVEKCHRRNPSMSLDILEKLPQLGSDNRALERGAAEFAQDQTTLEALLSTPQESPLLAELMQALHADLCALVEWHQDSNETDLSEKNRLRDLRFSGEVYLMRGALANRLQKERLAERAYRYVVNKGFSLYAWYKLMKIYTKTCNPLAVLSCVIEIVKHWMKDGVALTGDLPEWMEVELSQICSGCGINQLCATANELGCSRYPCIARTIKKLRYWRVDGC